MVNDDLKKQLIEAAIETRENAYAPYSSFKVGASLVCSDGSLFQGCNVENASYGLTICAERVAIGNAVATGQRKFNAICVASSGAVTPCGACRQFINEFGSDTLIILVDAVSGEAKREFTAMELLPESFKL